METTGGQNKNAGKKPEKSVKKTEDWKIMGFRGDNLIAEVARTKTSNT